MKETIFRINIGIEELMDSAFNYLSFTEQACTKEQILEMLDKAYNDLVEFIQEQIINGGSSDVSV